MPESVDISVLEGWLIKEKSRTPKYSFLGDSNKRWFKVQVLRGLEGDELALCYFKDNKSKEPRGWVFANNVTEIQEDKVSITLVSPGKTFKLRAQTRAEHKLWANGFRAICTNAEFASYDEHGERIDTSSGAKDDQPEVMPAAKAESEPAQAPSPAPEEAKEKNTTLKKKKKREPAQPKNDDAEARPSPRPEAPPQRESSSRESHGSRDSARRLYDEDTDRRRERRDSRDGNRDYRRDVDDYDGPRGYRRRDEYERDSRERDRYDDHDRTGRTDDRDRGRGRDAHRRREDEDDQDYERWKAERSAQLRQQQQQQPSPQPQPSPQQLQRQTSTPPPLRRTSTPTTVNPRKTCSSPTTTTARVHRHIRAGSGSAAGGGGGPDAMDLESTVLSDTQRSDPSFPGTPRQANPRRFLQAAQSSSDEGSVPAPGDSTEPPATRQPEPVAPASSASLKVKRTAADELGGESSDAKGLPSGRREGEHEWERFTRGGGRMRHDSDSDDEKVDFQAEKTKLMLSMTLETSAGAKDQEDEQQREPLRRDAGIAESQGQTRHDASRPQDSKELHAPAQRAPDLDLPAEKPVPSSDTPSRRSGRSGRNIPAPSGPPSTPPDPSSPHTQRSAAVLPKGARPIRMRPSVPSPLAPAKQGRPVIAADDNFAEEDWDEDGGNKRPTAAGATVGGGGSGRVGEDGRVSVEKRRSGREDKGDRGAAHPGVKADDNWLHDDFDD